MPQNNLKGSFWLFSGLSFLKWFFLGLVFVKSASYSNAQKNYLKGFVVSNFGDTIIGEIDYQNWERNPKLIEFKNYSTKKNTNYKPGDISAFFVNNEYHKSAKVWIDCSLNKLGELTYEYKPKFKLDEVFLNVLVAGKTNLLYLKEENYREHYFLEKDSIEELVNARFLKKIDDKDHVVYPKRFKGQLLYSMKDCNSIKSQIEGIQYKSGDLIKIVKSYNECVGSNVSYVKKKDVLELRWYVGSGFALNRLKFNDGGNTYSKLPRIDFDGSQNITLGGAMELVLLRNRKKWSI